MCYSVIRIKIAHCDILSVGILDMVPAEKRLYTLLDVATRTKVNSAVLCSM